MEILFDGVRYLLKLAHVANTEFVEALPTAFMKPFSGGAARGMMLETFATHGVDSFIGKMAATFQGSTETTFYVLAVYFGSRSEEHTSELQSRPHLVCRLLLEKKKKYI